MKIKLSHSFIIVIVTAIILSCQRNVNKLNNKFPQNDTISSPHIGAWEMIYFRSISGADTTVLRSNGKPLAITLMTPSHFSYKWRNSSNSGAGTYIYDGKTIHEEFTYYKDTNFVGAKLSFNMELRNDSLIFSGPIKAVSSSGENMMHQIPQMLEIRRKAK